MNADAGIKSPVASRQGLAAQLATEMRTPLARVELAASQLAREATTPHGSALCTRVSEAVADLDRLVDRILGLLVPEPFRPMRHEDVNPVVESLRDRFAPLLAARGISWEESARGESPIAGDPDQVRIVAVALLRAASVLLSDGGSMRLDFVPERDRSGLALRVDPRGRQTGEARTLGRGQLEQLRARVLSRGISVELCGGEQCSGATAWLPRRVESCSAS